MNGLLTEIKQYIGRGAKLTGDVASYIAKKHNIVNVNNINVAINRFIKKVFFIHPSHYHFNMGNMLFLQGECMIMKNTIP